MALESSKSDIFPKWPESVLGYVSKSLVSKFDQKSPKRKCPKWPIVICHALCYKVVKLKNDHHFIIIDCTEKFQITDLSKVWVSGFPIVDRNGLSGLAIKKNLKNGCHFVNLFNHMQKFQITDPPKVWVSTFLSVNGNGISASASIKKLRNGCHFINITSTEKFQITDPPKVWVSIFRVLMEMEYQHQPL